MPRDQAQYVPSVSQWIAVHVFLLHIPILSIMADTTRHGHFSSVANLEVSDKFILNSSNLLLLLKTWTVAKELQVWVGTHRSW